MSGWKLELARLPPDFNMRGWNIYMTDGLTIPIGSIEVVKRSLLKIDGIKEDHWCLYFEGGRVWLDDKEPLQTITVELMGSYSHPDQRRVVGWIARHLDCWVMDTVGETIHPPSLAEDVFDSHLVHCVRCFKGSAVLFGACPYCGGRLEAVGAPQTNRQPAVMPRSIADVLLAGDDVICAALSRMDTSLLAVALKISLPDLRQKFLRNMSPSAGEIIREEMEFMGPVRLADVESAQEAVLRAFGDFGGGPGEINRVRF